MPKHEQKSSSRVFDKTNVTLLLAGFAAIAAAAFVVKATPRQLPVAQFTNGQATAAATAPTNRTANASAGPVWATSAPGRVEPKGGSVQYRAETSGRVVETYATAGETVRKDAIIARVRDDEAAIRLVQARAEVAVRLGERDEEPEKRQPVILQRAAADALAAAERTLHRVWLAYDTANLDFRAGKSKEADVSAARNAIEAAKSDINAKRAELDEISQRKGTPLPSRLDSGLTLARADLRLAEIGYENTRIRAPIAGTLLEFHAKAGEHVAPTAQLPVAVIGDMSAVQITAEVPERDVSKVRVGQAVIVRSNAFDGTEFPGKVVEVAALVGAAGLRARGPRQQFDAEVLEVKIELEGKPDLKPGMRVDVFFKTAQELSAVIHRK